ncbi:hypothetical protein [Marinobacter shengliensis]|uniref:hypothetical protein n=1 Tax=Marinobacter shengliensis TaxID=1389223 RepID=UPI001108AEF4|nr:hypothetical protein [Marinobacter shengliensis]
MPPIKSKKSSNQQKPQNPEAQQFQQAPQAKIPIPELPVGSGGNTGPGSFSVNPPMPVGAGWLLDFLPEKDV